MSFLGVNDLLLVCVVLNHDADTSFYIIKNDIFIEYEWEIAVACCGRFWQPGSLLKNWKWRQALSQHMGHSHA